MRNIFALIVAFFIAGTVSAQISIGISLNLNTQPAWGPTGYDYVENYYLPDIDVYYNVTTHRYYYYDKKGWRYSVNLPSRYRNYDIYNSYKVVVNEKNPWKNHKSYKEKYSSYKGRHDQQPIRDSRDSKYYANKYHPEHNNWVKQQKHDNGNRDGMKKGSDNRNKKNGKNKK
ncbi:MAG: hypothetical protein CVV24_04590 [Ignavibacteriae bacterium HGW-Ignavibacteriae-3]|nr:MAG: hypothetical protein CVV24_04590 [Ignavibacteriae bacterium HGW-Ignavibacteriae-3]